MLLLVTAAGLLAPTAHPATTDAYAADVICPGPEPLVARADWHPHRLAPGIQLTEARVRDRYGIVGIHVVKVDLTRTSVRFRPLVSTIASRHRLSRLAAGRPRLVAATNTGFYDFTTGAPTGPLVLGGQPLLATTEPQSVIGISDRHRVQAGQVTLRGTVQAGLLPSTVTALNTSRPRTGLTVYTPAWGAARVPLRWTDIAVTIKAGKVTSHVGAYNHVPSGGRLLVARGKVAETWLRTLHVGDTVTTHLRLVTTTARPFTQAYGVGVQTVRNGQRRTDLSCRASYPMPARTGIGFANQGRRLIIAAVEDHPGTRLHGLDQKQMSALMADLGADQAFAWDGSGSTELIARMPADGRLDLRTYPADGAERPLPVGFGILTGAG